MALAALRPGDPSQLGSYELIGRLGTGGQGGGATGGTLYPSLGCQGQLTLVPGSSGGVIRLTEQITSGPCTTSGEFTVQLSGAALKFTYQPDATDQPASYGTLHR
jgi:hypothetical protein